MKKLLLATAMLTLAGCATITNEENVPIALSFSDNSAGNCKLENKRMKKDVELPATIQFRRSDDAIAYDCTTKDGKTATGQIQSVIGAKIVASAVFLDFGIVDSITDKHREYPASFVIPVVAE